MNICRCLLPLSKWAFDLSWPGQGYIAEYHSFESVPPTTLMTPVEMSSNQGQNQNSSSCNPVALSEENHWTSRRTAIPPPRILDLRLTLYRHSGVIIVDGIKRRELCSASINGNDIRNRFLSLPDRGLLPVSKPVIK